MKSYDAEHGVTRSEITRFQRRVKFSIAGIAAGAGLSLLFSIAAFVVAILHT